MGLAHSKNSSCEAIFMEKYSNDNERKKRAPLMSEKMYIDHLGGFIHYAEEREIVDPSSGNSVSTLLFMKGDFIRVFRQYLERKICQRLDKSMRFALVVQVKQKRLEELAKCKEKFELQSNIMQSNTIGVSRLKEMYTEEQKQIKHSAYDKVLKGSHRMSGNPKKNLSPRFTHCGPCLKNSFYIHFSKAILSSLAVASSSL